VNRMPKSSEAERFRRHLALRDPALRDSCLTQNILNLGLLRVRD
jgi:hypothetical protein